MIEISRLEAARDAYEHACDRVRLMRPMLERGVFPAELLAELYDARNTALCELQGALSEVTAS